MRNMLCVKLRSVVLFLRILGDFRLEYEYEIDYEYDFSNRERILKIIT